MFRGDKFKFASVLSSKLGTNLPRENAGRPVERRQGGREPRVQSLRPPADRA